jgi:hypothetical protein
MNELSTRLYSALQTPTLPARRKTSTFHPSSASIEVPDPAGGTKIIGTCLRQQYFRMTEAPQTNEGIPDWKISADLGDKMHELVLNYIDDYGFQMGLQRLAAEHPFYDDRVNITGRSDIIVWDHRAKKPIGIEVKSIGEYKASKCLESPADEHVLQAMLYLEYYQSLVPEGMVKPERWYIWYISRTENWSLKGKKHGSPLTMLWDYYITLDGPEQTVVVHSFNGTERWSAFSVLKIHNRYFQLKEYLKNDTLPPRDYEIQFTEEKIAGLYSQDLLTRKTDKQVVERWLKKGGPKGKLKLTLGNFECQLCQWKDKCWNNPVSNIVKGKVNLPMKELNPPIKEPKKDIFI